MSCWTYRSIPARVYRDLTMSTEMAVAREDNPAPADFFASPADVLREFERVGYFTTLSTASAVYYGNLLSRPILQEGPAGAGKTELAVSLSKATGMPLIRLQCYDGIDDRKAIGDFNRSMQELYVLINREAQREWWEIRTEIMSREFFVPGPLLSAIETPERSILLIDEVDKVPQEFEALLLEILSVWEMSVPGLGTLQPVTVPFAIITSNAARELGDPLRRRSIFLPVEHPEPIQEARIVAVRTPGASPKTHLFIAGLAQALRSFNLEKRPSISEMIDLARVMEAMNWTTILPEQRETVLPLLVKRVRDVERLRMKDQFAVIVRRAAQLASEIPIDSVRNASEEGEAEWHSSGPKAAQLPGGGAIGVQ